METAEILTRQFYAWEKIGRGWNEYELSVQLEPQFRPFFGHSVPRVHVEDDSKVPSLFKRIFTSASKPKAIDIPEEEELLSYLDEDEEHITIYSVSLPKGHKVEISETEQLLLMLSYCDQPVSFEIIGTYSAIAIQVVSRISDTSHVFSQLKAYFPECIIREQADLIQEVTENAASGNVIEYGLRDEFMRPLAMADNFKIDPFIGLFGALDHLEDGQYVVIQILFQGTVNPWAESITRAVLDNSGGHFFADAPDMVPLAKEKISYPLFAVTMKILTASTTPESAKALSTMAGKSFGRLFFSASNALIPLLTGLPFEEKVDSFILRKSTRLGMLLNSRELATIVHLPSASVTNPKFVRNVRKTKAAPKSTEGNSFLLGTNEHHGKVKEVTVNSQTRLRHTHVIGATGTGKSTFLLSQIKNDIDAGNAVIAIDPHGDLVESILKYIPVERIQDVVIIDPADQEYPIAFNILSAHSEIEKEILSSDLVAGFKRLSTSWGDQMNSVFANAILAFLESSKGGTLVDLRRFLIEKPFRDQFLTTVDDPNVRYYWQKEFPILKTNSIGPILTRLDTFLRPKLIRHMVAQKKGLDFEMLLDTKKIVLVKLSQGLIGAENSYLLGTVIVSKIHQAAMARQAKLKEDRSDVFLYVDEFQNFITPSMSAILSGARKYNLGLILAHQDMQQVIKYDSELASSVVANAGTRICFRLGDTDAKRFADGFSYFEASDLQNLNTGEAICRIERPEFDFSLSVDQLPASTMGIQEVEVIINLSRQKYGTPKSVVENLLRESMTEATEIHTEVSTPAAPQSYTPIQSTVQPISTEQQASTIEKLVKQKEQSQHRYLQNLIKKMAEARGFTASIEELTPNAKGRVDVSLQKNGKKLAVEICVTTEKEWELHNIEKCIGAGYDIVIECCNDPKALEAIKRKVQQSFSAPIQEKIKCLHSEALFQYLDDTVAKEATTETRMKGYRVKIEYGSQPLEKKNTSLKSDHLKTKKKGK